MSDGANKTLRTWVFDAEVRGHYIPEAPLVIDDFELKTIEDTEKGTKYMAFLTIQALDIYDAEKLAREEFERFFEALRLSTGRGFEFELKSGTEKRRKEDIKWEQGERRYHIGFISVVFPFNEILKIEEIERIRDETKEILQLLARSDEISKKAIEYFTIGTKLSRWPREAFLPFFKAIELISDKFKPEFEHRIKKRIPDLESEEIKRLATSKRKISNACKILGIEDTAVDRIVEMRNKRDIAHATLKKRFRKEYVDECREFARKLILGYIKSLQ